MWAHRTYKRSLDKEKSEENLENPRWQKDFGWILSDECKKKEEY